MTTSRRIRHTGLALLCAGALTLPLAATAPAAALAATANPKDPEILRTRTVALKPGDYHWLCGSQPFGAPREHTFELFHDVKLRVVEDRLDRDGPALTWTGHVKDEPSSNAVLSVNGVCDTGADAAPASVEGHIDVGERVFRLAVPGGEPGRLRITEEDPSHRKQPVGDDIDATRPRPDPKAMLEGLERLKKRAAVPGPVVIDMIVGYTPAAVRRVGGDSAMQARIKLAESYLNQAFADSNVQASVDVIGTYDTHYAGDQTASVMLPKLSRPTDLELGARAAQLREEYGVDLVSVINDVPNGSSGQANLPVPFLKQGSDKDAFSVVDVSSIVNWYNFGHEIGHNLGLWHDRTTLNEQAGGQDYRPYLTTPSSTGFITRDHDFHTVMAYSSACGRPCAAVNQYSNTENTVNGQPLGDKDNNNAATARLTAPVVAGYRTLKTARERYSLTLDPSQGGTVRPSTYGPYRAGTTIAVNAYPAPGYRITGWESDGSRYQYTGSQVTLAMNTDHTVRALFTRM